MRKQIWGWYFFDWACQPFYTLMWTFIFGPFFAAVAVEYYLSTGLSADQADAQAQQLWAWALAIVGVGIGLAAPFLGAMADTTGRRKPWLMGFTMLIVLGAGLTWYSDPAGSNLIFMLAAFCIAFMGAEFALIFANSQLPELAQGDDRGPVSGSAMAFGYIGGVVSLFIVLLLFVAQGNGKTLLGIDPLFGFDPALKEGTRFTGPFVAIWCIVFAIPYFLWVGEIKTTVKTKFGAAMGRLKSTVCGLGRRRSTLMFLLSSMFARDAVNGIYTFGGIYATLVLEWDIVKIGVFGIISALGAAGFSFLGGRLDRKLGSKPVLTICMIGLIVVCIVIIGMTPNSLFGVPLAQGSNLPDIIFFICGIVIGGLGGALQASARTLMAHHTRPGFETLEYGLYGLSGRATAFLAPVLIGVATAITGSARLGVSPLILLFIIGLVLLAWVHPKGDAEQWSNG